MSRIMGLVMALSVSVYATVMRLDRDRALHPVMLIVIASFYVLFAVMGASVRVVVTESLVAIVRPTTSGGRAEARRAGTRTGRGVGCPTTNSTTNFARCAVTSSTTTSCSCSPCPASACASTSCHATAPRGDAARCCCGSACGCDVCACPPNCGCAG
jgi:hypothetical protein